MGMIYTPCVVEQVTCSPQPTMVVAEYDRPETLSYDRPETLSEELKVIEEAQEVSFAQESVGIIPKFSIEFDPKTNSMATNVYSLPKSIIAPRFNTSTPKYPNKPEDGQQVPLPATIWMGLLGSIGVIFKYGKSKNL
jgi:hypothetical protein